VIIADQYQISQGTAKKEDIFGKIVDISKQVKYFST
jgi:hypothetical protein